MTVDHDHDFPPDLDADATCSVCGIRYTQWTLAPLDEALKKPPQPGEALLAVHDALRQGDDPAHVLDYVTRVLVDLGFDLASPDEPGHGYREAGDLP